MKSLFSLALLHPNIHICHKPSTISPLFWLRHADMRANTPDTSGHWPNKTMSERIEREREREGSERYVSK
jgi:hypothetical protein